MVRQANHQTNKINKKQIVQQVASTKPKKLEFVCKKITYKDVDYYLDEHGGVWSIDKVELVGAQNITDNSTEDVHLFTDHVDINIDVPNISSCAALH